MMLSKKEQIGGSDSTGIFHAMKISELARATATSADTIRYYEREGLLPAAARNDNNWRSYGSAHVKRLAFIRQGRGLGMSLEEIRTLLRFLDAPCDDCGEVNRMVDEHIRHTARRISELRQLERQLRALRARCPTAQEAARCGILRGMAEQAAQDGPPPAPVQGVHG